MISRRRYFAIMLIFLAVFMLFQGLQMGRVFLTDTSVNPHASETGLRAASARAIQDMKPAADEQEVPKDPYLLFLGDERSPCAKTIQEWASYANLIVFCASSLPLPEAAGQPYLILADSGSVEAFTEELIRYAEQGTDVLCTAIPSVQSIKESESLRSLLGIQKVQAEQITLHGIHLFPGFFLGGERIFEAKDEGDPRQDMALTVPWYTVRTNTKTYMRGILSDEDFRRAAADRMKNEDYPAIIWRNHLGEGEIYAVNGAYFDDREIAMGILAAVLYERSAYLLYPVVNSQVFSMVDFPLASDENSEAMVKLYGRDITKFESDIIIPQVQSLASRHGFKASCFMSVKYDYDDPAQPQSGLVKDYLSILYDIGGELALSCRYAGSFSPQDMMETDTDYYLGEKTTYPFYAAFVQAEDMESSAKLLSAHPIWQSIRTLSVSQSDDLPLLGYAGDDMTFQQVTNDAVFHSFTDDLELVCLQTALGYENMSLYMSDVFWPETARDEWQNASREASGIISTYNVPFQAFGKTTISESDGRVRVFLSLEYEQERIGDTVRLAVSGTQGSAYFILRTHGEEIQSISGGHAEKIEDGAYLISAEQESLEIDLGSSFWRVFQLKGDL